MLKPRAHLEVRRKSLPLQRVLPLLRITVCLLLLVMGGWGGWRWLSSSGSAQALEFTPQLISGRGGAMGVKGTAAADIDGDDDQDIITAGRDGIKVYENIGNHKFTTHVVEDDEDFDGERVQVADFDRDGKQDLLVTQKGAEPSVRWWRQEGDFSFNGTPLGTTGMNAVAYAGDINNDGNPDIVTARTEGEVVILSRWMNNGSGSFTETVLDNDTGVSAITIGDVDSNDYRDIVTGGTQGLQRWKTVDGLIWERIDIDDSNPNQTHIRVADPGDGRTFIITGDDNKNSVAVYRGASDGYFQRILLEGDTDAKTVAVGDIDSDADLDIVVASQDDNEIVWFEYTQNDVWVKRSVATGLQSVYGVTILDSDGDGDLDFVAGDHYQGNLYVYERIRVKPAATAPTTISQSTNGSGLVTFKTTLSDGDRDPSRVRVQYTRDGKIWEKPWLTKVTVSSGSVDLKNSNGFQVGTSNAIDTDQSEMVTLTFTWDTKSSQNTGGALTGNLGSVQLRILPRDDRNMGTHAVSAEFQVDNQAPTGLKNLRLAATTSTTATLTWQAPSDSSAAAYRIYYGTDATAVLNEQSSVWDSTQDAALDDIATTTTTITDLGTGTAYTFKIVVKDQFGNSATTSSVRGRPSSASPSSSPTTTTTPLASPLPTTPAATSVVPVPIVSPFVSPTPPFQIPSIVPSPTEVPVVITNKTPLTDAGSDQVVNPSALVILDGTGSTDPDSDVLSYDWQLLEGPPVELISPRTATPSFSAAEQSGTYVFALAAQDTKGALAVDHVTVVIRPLSVGVQVPVAIAPSPTFTPGSSSPELVTESPWLTALLRPADLLLLLLSVVSTILLLVERSLRRLQDGKLPTRAPFKTNMAAAQPQGKVINAITGEPISDAQVLIYGQDGKLRATERSNAQGVFGTFFPPGEYTLGVKVPGFDFAPAKATLLSATGTLIYTGGKIVVRSASTPLSLVIPLKPVGTEIGGLKVRFLHFWQRVQWLGRLLSWPIFLAGSLLNTALVFIAPTALYLGIEVLYIVLVIIKIALEVKVRPAYGQVRDAIMHIPLDLAVVRLFEQDTNRLVMTRVTNNQGKFFALPPTGMYTITISKPGYANFSKSDVMLRSEHDTTLQLTADLVPLAPMAGGLSKARAAIL